MTVAQAALLLGVSEETVRRAFDAGEIDGFRTRPDGGWRKLYRRSVDQYRRARGENV